METADNASLMARLRRVNCRSLRDLFCVVVAVATLSIAVTYHVSLSKTLPPPGHQQQAQLQIRFNGRVDIYRNLDLPSSRSNGQGQQLPGDDNAEIDSRNTRDHPHHQGESPRGAPGRDSRQGLEGMDIEAWEGHLREQRNRRRRTLARRSLRPEVLEKLKEIDATLLGDPRAQKTAVLHSDSSDLGLQGDSYRQSLVRAGYTVYTLAAGGADDDAASDHQRLPGQDNQGQRGYSRQVWDTGWGLVLCLHHEDGGDGDHSERLQASASSSVSSVCQLPSGSVARTQPSKKINVIPELDSMFATRWNFCVTMTTARYIPGLSPTSPPCFLLPQQYEDFLRQADSRGPNVKWVLKPLGQDGGPPQLVEPTRDKDFFKIRKYSTSRSLVQEYQREPLPLYGLPFSATLYVLVTSWHPLRAFIHSYGVISFRRDYQGNFRKIPGRTWTLEQWFNHVAETRHQPAAEVAKRNMESVITQTLLVTEVIHKSERRCQGCFQLMSFDLIFNSTFYPVVLNINSRPDLSESVHVDDDHKHNAVIQDMIAMVTATTPIATDVAIALEELNLEVTSSAGGNCPSTSNSQTCLTSDDISYLLSLRRESVQKGGFRLLYPSIESDRYSVLISHLDKYSQLLGHPQRRLGDRSSQTSPRTTANLHTVARSFLRYLYNLEKMDEAYDDLNIPLFSEQQLQNKDASHNLMENIYNNETNSEDPYVKHQCVEDKDLMPYIDAIHTDPPLDLSPEFTNTTTDYYATVPYDVFLVKVWAFAISCYCEARLEDKYGLSRPSNMTLGLGNNRISILVVDIRHTEPWTINTYTLYIYRQPAGEGLSVLDQAVSHSVCSLVQDCGLRYLPYQPCGLRPSTYTSWQQYKKQAAAMPKCDRGDEQGEWLVPCNNCSQSESCSWSSAVWQPRRCSHFVLPRDKIKQCLRGKQILFIGDSTNRGMMHYVMEQVNSSLTEWDKTHDVKIYRNINQEQTAVSFAYYPQFWLPSNQRPVFDKALSELMRQTGALENNHNTVLVVGGVHWLATHHLRVIAQALKREGLDNIQVIVKGLGAGFHLPVDGVHCLTLTEQRKLVAHNVGLMSFAATLGFQVVDTFNMTMARYRDFLQGKCACHFHRVKEVLPSFTKFLQGTSHIPSDQIPDMPIQYHVEGNINGAYSEILLNTVCQDHGDR